MFLLAMNLPELPLSTPSLLFPAISLLMLAYTNRFLTLSQIVRSLHATWKNAPTPIIAGQIKGLRKRIRLIRNMQSLGVLSLMACTVSMTLLFFNSVLAGQISFVVSLALMTGSLGFSLWEILLSENALELHLSDMEADKKN